MEKFCMRYKLGELNQKPRQITGGLMHKMYDVQTTTGRYAIKVLNPSIMERKEAVQNMIVSEQINKRLSSVIPSVVAKDIDGHQLLFFENQYFMIYDWKEGASVFAPCITIEHCKKIGEVLGKIHEWQGTIIGLEKEYNNMPMWDWEKYLDLATRKNCNWLEKYEAAISDLVHWNQKAREGSVEISADMVISHRDLDPKNVMWNDYNPILIDWEAAGYVNPYQELLEVINYWACNSDGSLNTEYLKALIVAYSNKMPIAQVKWENIFDSSYEGMLGWLEYSLKRALGLEGKSEVENGANQVIRTIRDLYDYEKNCEVLKKWLMVN